MTNLGKSFLKKPNKFTNNHVCCDNSFVVIYNGEKQVKIVINHDFKLNLINNVTSRKILIGTV